MEIPARIPNMYVDSSNFVSGADAGKFSRLSYGVFAPSYLTPLVSLSAKAAMTKPTKFSLPSKAMVQPSPLQP